MISLPRLMKKGVGALLLLWSVSGCAGSGSSFQGMENVLDYEPQTDTEESVQNIIAEDGVHVIHFWAPWCHNSIAELREGWYELIEENEDITFTFVTVWSNNESGRETLDQYAIPANVVELTQPDLGDSDIFSNRRRTFLNLPLTWTPSTWIFHKNGELAFALNYGEQRLETLRLLIAATQQDWLHE